MLKNFKALLCAIAAVTAFTQLAQASGTETYIGIGVTVHQDKKGFQITDLIASGPAINSGVKLDDWIMAVDAKETKGLKLDEVVALIGGAVGTPVTLTLEDDKTHTPHDVKIIRAEVTIECLLKGNINLNYFGDARTGTISGFIGQDNVHLSIFNGTVSGRIDQDFIHLRIDERQGFGATVEGWIRGTYVTWRSSGHMFFGYQRCIY